MDIKWKDDYENIINATENVIKIKTSDSKIIKFSNNQVYRVSLNDMLLTFYDKNEDEIAEIDIPKKRLSDAVKIFNAYDKSGKMYSGKSNDGFLNFMITLMSAGDPISNTVAFVGVALTYFLLFRLVLWAVLGKWSFLIIAILILIPFALKFKLYLDRKKLKTEPEDLIDFK